VVNEKSLEDKSILKKLKILSTEVGDVTDYSQDPLAHEMDEAR
jgi:hypothetical protein